MGLFFTPFPACPGSLHTQGGSTHRKKALLLSATLDALRVPEELEEGEQAVNEPRDSPFVALLQLLPVQQQQPSSPLQISSQVTSAPNQNPTSGLGKAQVYTSPALRPSDTSLTSSMWLSLNLLFPPLSLSLPASQGEGLPGPFSWQMQIFLHSSLLSLFYFSPANILAGLL